MTITAGKGVTAVYVDGVLTTRSSSLSLVSNDLTGRLVMANSTVDQSWTGEIAGLAIYDRELTPGQVATHFESWKHGQPPSALGEAPPKALYLFDEGEGNVAHNEVDPETDLIIPPRYFVLHPAFLRSFWDQFEDAGNVWVDWGYWKDIAVNIAGFMLVGFVLIAYFSSLRSLRWPGLLVIILGSVMSFTIEVLQSFLPTRESGMTDLVTNTGGTACGVALYKFCVQSLVSRIGHRRLCLGKESTGYIATEAATAKVEHL